MINQLQIQQQILALLNSTATEDPVTAANDFSNKLATVIVQAIQSAVVTLPPGSVLVAGSATNQTNPAPIIVPNALS